MCEQLEKEPDPTKMPLDRSVFPDEVQAAFLVYDLLSDRWDTNSGMYLGKDWSTIEYFFKIHHIERDQEDILLLLKMIENKNVGLSSKELDKRRKAEERKASAAGGGPQYAHNIKG